MKTYHNHRQEPYFTFLKNGQKTIEGRLQKGWYLHVAPGDHINVSNADETDSITTEVIRVQRYKNIREMLKSEGIGKLLPDIVSIDDGINVYRRYYTAEDEKSYGAVAIEVRVIDNG